jgi:hypothetical protein
MANILPFTVSVDFQLTPKTRTLLDTFFTPEPYDPTFNWKRDKSGGFVLSPYPERILPYKEVDFEFSEKDLGVVKCLSLSQRLKFGKYPNLHPLGFQNLYLVIQKGKKLRLTPNVPAFLPKDDFINALIKAFTIQYFPAPAIPYTSKRMKLPEGIKTEPVIGYRCFLVNNTSHGVGLSSTVHDREPWLSKTHTTATCTRGFQWEKVSHTSPDENCTCGLHAFSHVGSAIQYGSPGLIIASIVAWGKVIQHDDNGFRSQYARVIGLTSYSNHSDYTFGLSLDVFDKLSCKYNVPVFDTTEALELAASEYGNVLQ